MSSRPTRPNASGWAALTRRRRSGDARRVEARWRPAAPGACLVASVDPEDAAATLAHVRRLRDAGLMLPVIALGPHSTFRTAVDIARLAETDFLERPVSAHRLRLALQAALAGARDSACHASVTPRLPCVEARMPAEWSRRWPLHAPLLDWLSAIRSPPDRVKGALVTHQRERNETEANVHHGACSARHWAWRGGPCAGASAGRSPTSCSSWATTSAGCSRASTTRA